MQTKILECRNAASQLLQAKEVDTQKASTLLQNTVSVLMEFRKQFDEAKSVTLALTTKWESQMQFKTTRARKVTHRFDELSEDGRLTTAKCNSQVNTFNACLDIDMQQLPRRLKI